MITYNIRPNPLPPFRILYDLPKNTWLVCNVGPRGSGKSYEAAKWVTLQILNKKKRAALLRDEQTTIGESILHEVKMRFNEINEKCNGYFSKYWDMQEHVLKNYETGVKHLFSKGFRASRTIQRAGLKSISDIDIALIEEFEDIQSEDKFNTFADSIRKEGAVIVINSNIPAKNHWFVKRYYNLEQQESPFEAYYKLLPKDMPGVVYITSDYTGNIHLPANTVARYQGYGDINSPLYNLDHYATDILGLVSEGGKGRIYPGWKTTSNKLFNELPFFSYYGLDFGYSNDPVALVEVKTHNRKNYYRELIYEVGLTDDVLADKIKALNIKGPIYADSAEPKSIATLKKYGVYVFPADKGPDSVDFGIKTIKAMQNFYTEDSKNLRKENEEYRWHLDPNKEPTNVPEDKNNHLKDAIRYAVITHKGERKIDVGVYSSPDPQTFAGKQKNKLDYL